MFLATNSDYTYTNVSEEGKRGRGGVERDKEYSFDFFHLLFSFFKSHKQWLVESMVAHLSTIEWQFTVRPHSCVFSVLH